MKVTGDGDGDGIDNGRLKHINNEGENKTNTINQIDNNYSDLNVQHKQNNTPILFPNGLLIYHKNRLIKRYYPSFGMFNPFLNSSVSNLIGVIEIN